MTENANLWWWAKCKYCGERLAIRPSRNAEGLPDVNGLTPEILNPFECSKCGAENLLDYEDLQEATRKDGPDSRS
jgi:DNA-directed RNA polymerase subunit RPC12/RpoP